MTCTKFPSSIDVTKELKFVIHKVFNNYVPSAKIVLLRHDVIYRVNTNDLSSFRYLFNKKLSGMQKSNFHH